MKKLSTSILAMALLLPIAACTSEEPVVLRGGEFITTVDGTEITLNFADDADRAFGRVVNTYNAPYEINGRNIRFGPAAATMMMGLDENAMRVEFEYFQFLNAVETFKLSGNELLLRATDGKEIVFEKLN
ncbi:MAG: META domain-containing protein [Alphaproteobacteria bacterium]|nr:META domain-containing protein [Alphaproteobacteria bacterium]MCL2890203.1 META domain-containing protein [Alphaproteobacteria bacterium]